MTTIMKVLGVALSVGSLTAGCMTDEEPEVGTSNAPGIREGQGRYVLGQVADGFVGPTGYLWAVKANTFSVGTVSVTNACLALSANGPCSNMVGATASSYDGVTITITGDAATALPNTHVYTVQYTKGATTAPLCPDGAIVTAGAWSTTGFHDNLNNHVSFSCLDPGGDNSPALSNKLGGVAAKAVMWGFAPGMIGSQGWKDHQLATVLGRADYCGDGTVRTLNATGIKYYLANTGPVHGPMAPYPQDIVDGAFYPEAAWTTAANNESRGATCLAKLRWSTMPVGDPCTGLPDPRLHAVEEGAGFCDDYTIEKLWSGGARIFNDSQYNVVGLWQWTKAGDHYASTGGFYAGVRTSDTILPPGAGALYSSSNSGRIGTLLTNDGKATYLASYPGATFVEIVTAKHQNNGDWITTTASTVPGSYGTSRHEGWLFASVPNVANRPSTAVFTALYRHKKIAGTDTMVSTNISEPGFTNQTTLGYLGDF